MDVAVEELGADRASYSTADRINSGKAKIEQLREICPGLLDPGVNVVGITDEEQRRRNNGNAGYLDPRRKDRGPTEKVELNREGLHTVLAICWPKLTD